MGKGKTQKTRNHRTGKRVSTYLQNSDGLTHIGKSVPKKNSQLLNTKKRPLTLKN
jgi:hypothetical protein